MGRGKQGENDYLLADPRLAEAPDNGTVEPHTGADRSAPQALLDPNRPHSQNLSGEGEGGRKRAASDTGSSTRSSRSGTSFKATLQKRRRQSGRQNTVLERHRHWSVSGVAGQGAQRAGAREEVPRYYGTGEQVQEVDGERDGERDDDEDATDPRHDIQARLRRAPGVIVADTWANRPRTTRAPIDKYQAGTKTGAKKPGRGRGQ